MTGGPARVIPRPSERRRNVVADDLIIIDAPRSPHRRSAVASTGHENDARSSTLTVIGWSSALASAVAFGALGLTDREDTTLGLVLVPLFAGLAFIGLRRWVLPPHGNRIFATMFAAFGLRLLAAVPRLMGGADSPVYQREGVRIAEALRSFDLTVETGRAVPGTGSVRYFSGVVNVLTGSSFIATFLVFTLIAFVGQVFFLVGVRRSLNDDQFTLLALLLAFSPTMAFWPSSIGKESLALFGIGFAAFGASRLYDRRWVGAVPVTFGLFAIGMIRPHVAMVMLIGVLIGLFARRAHTRGRLATHTLLLMIVLVGSMLATSASANLFGLESLDGFSDVSDALDFAQQRTSQDEAQFVAARVDSIQDYPWAAVTVLFRPFPWEVESGVAMISALEATVLLGLVLRAVPGCIIHLRAILQRGQLLLSVTFVSVFVYVFSAIGNFGILSRQRAQVIPFVLLFVAFGTHAERRRSRMVGRA